jgi:uncharacterized protein YacL
MAEVSNLSDLTGRERVQARKMLVSVLSLLDERWLPSREAAADGTFEALGLTDAAIVSAARVHKGAVLTSDLNLYLALCRDGLPAVNFAHLHEAAWRT